MTPEEREQLAKAIKEANRFREELYVLRGGKPFSPSWKIINEMRDERTHELE